MLLAITNAFAQLYYTSKNNYTGDWENSQSWTKQQAWMADPPPATTLSGGQITDVYGYITRTGDLTITGGSVLNIYDTLVIRGSLTVANEGIVVKPGGLLVVLGDFTSTTSGGAKLQNDGNVVLVGEFVHWEGTISGGPNLYIYDDTPFVDSAGAPFPNNTENEQDLAANDPPLKDFMDGLGVTCGFGNVIAASQFVCTGSTAATLTGNVVSGATYRWQSSITSATTGFSNTAITTANFSPGVPAVTIWYRRQVTLSGCTSTSAAVKITVMGAGGWTGATNTDWNTNSNWCANTKPTNTTDAIIPVVSNGRYPDVNAAAAARDIIVSTGAYITLSGNTLSVYRDINTLGTFPGSGGTLLLRGTGQQTLSGNDLTLTNLSVNNTSASQIILTKNVTVTGTLTLTAGTINASGRTLTLGADVNNRGTLTYTAGKVINGKFARWLRTWTLAENAADNGNTNGYFFPVGTSADMRGMTIWFPSTAPSTGGTISVSHTLVSGGTTGLAINDPNPANRIIRRANSFWTVASGNGLAGGTYFMKAGGTGFGTVTSLNHLRLMRVNSVVGTNDPATGSFTDFSARRTGLSLAEINSNFYIGSTNNASPLPIKLKSFIIQKVDERGIALSWTTTMEKNFDYFLLERAGTDLKFETIAKVSGKGGLDIQALYEFTDATPNAGKNYYRLKSVDLDFAFEYSSVIAAEWGNKSGQLEIYPTIVHHSFTIELGDYNAAANVHMQLLDNMGYPVFEQKISDAKTSVEIPASVKPGNYFVRLKTDLDNDASIVRVIVQ